MAKKKEKEIEIEVNGKFRLDALEYLLSKALEIKEEMKGPVKIVSDIDNYIKVYKN